MAATEAFLREEVEFELDTLVRAAKGLDKLKAVQEGVNAVNRNDATRDKFGVLAREMFKRYKGLLHNQAIYAFKPRRDAINAIYGAIQESTYAADISAVMSRIQQIVDESIDSLDIALEPTEDYGTKVDISSLDFERIEQEFLKPNNKNTTVQSVKTAVEQKLNRMLDQNPLRINYYEKYQGIIEAYNRGKDALAVEETFSQLKHFYGELSEEEARAAREGLTEAEQTIFDHLHLGKQLKDKEKHEIKAIARTLLEQLEAEHLKVTYWAEKTQTASAVRQQINNILFERLPYPVYDEEDVQIKTDLLFQYFRKSYGGMVA
ncbi:MAG: DUF3387 domain-containing protein [Phaeodactylibacter sp.]|nr:DUF3387 domain-containing protein [Phaeodactylibacter sp.]